ncbi:hypothetical protein PAXRUDRAFT_115601, partial [Paxillus rubicundulus Ve08.2h10]
YHRADCSGQPLLCTSCCQLAHQLHPFHRVGWWSRYHFASSSMRAAGLMFYLGHGREKHP